MANNFWKQRSNKTRLGKGKSSKGQCPAGERDGHRANKKGINYNRELQVRKNIWSLTQEKASACQPALHHAGGGWRWGLNRVLSSEVDERCFTFSVFIYLFIYFKWPYIAYLLSLKNPVWIELSKHCITEQFLALVYRKSRVKLSLSERQVAFQFSACFGHRSRNDYLILTSLSLYTGIGAGVSFSCIS